MTPEQEAKARELVTKLTTGPNHTAEWDGKGHMIVTDQDFFDNRELVALIASVLEMDVKRPTGGQNF